MEIRSMSDSAPGRPDADRNLLFGVLALQLDFIDRNALIHAMNAWVLDKTRPLGLILLDLGALRADAHLLLEALVQKHLEMHSGDPHKSLAAVASFDPIRAHLQPIKDPDLHASLAAVPTDLYATRPPPSGPARVTEPAPAAADPYATQDHVGQETASPHEPSIALGMRFRVLRHLARGGLGEVFVAVDQELGREVALKEIQSHHADHPDNRARFILEAEITGGLEHPGIVPVYGLGAYPDGRPYYAMRFIRGDSLQDTIRHFHDADKGARDPGQRGLELRRLLSRFVAVCNAIGYAHSRGVLHRDIKPANVMLGPYGETLVVDWGLAKPVGCKHVPDASAEATLRPTSSNDSAPTQMGAAVGTPAFMSPEQAAGLLEELGPQSDVYSLGATLYHLLTGQAPFGGGDVSIILQKVRNGDFLPPRQVNKGVPPALDAICRKAMALRAEDRYPSAQALAGEIEHWLADEPVSVYREPWTARAARWARRHRTLVVASAVLLVSAVPGLTITTVLVSREQARTAEQRQLAEANFQTALEAVDHMLTEVAQEQLAPEPRMEKKRLALLAQARTYYQQFLDQRGNEPGLRKEAALAHKRLGDIARLLGDYEQARAAYDQAVAMLASLAAEHPANPAYRFELSVSLDDLGEVWRRTSHPEKAADAYRRAVDLQKQLTTEDHDRPEYRKELARSQDNLGILLKDTQQPQGAEASFGAAIVLFRQLAADYPRNPEYRQHLARASLNLGPVLQGLGRPQEAEKVLQQAIALQTELADKDPTTPDYRYELGASYNNLGFLFESTRGQPQEAGYRPTLARAEAAYRQALDRYKRLADDFPNVPVYRKELALTQNNLAIVLARDHKWSAAEEAWSRALALFEKLAAEHPDVPDYEGYRALALENLGWLLLQPKDQPEMTAAAASLAASSPQSGPLAGLSMLLAGRTRQPETLRKAGERLEKAMDLTRSALKANPNHPTYLQALRDQSEYLAEARADLGEHAEAARIAEGLPGIFRTRGQDYFLAARLLARCLTLAQRDTRLTEEQRRTSSGRYADQALEFLREGIVRGYKDAEPLTRPPFTALGDRPAFQKLLAQLKGNPPPQVP
jgi:eukaryotic-like serine/threonine-protein kinase